jgi:sugar/nucleoside kinase (ribokinase family)
MGNELSHVVVVGPVFLDVVMAGLDRLPASGEEIHGASASWAPGGYAIGAITFSRMGIPTHLFTEIGNDELGAVIRGRLVAEGVEVFSPPNVDTTNIAVALNWNGDRGIVSYTQPFHDASEEVSQFLDETPGLVVLSARHPHARKICEVAHRKSLPVALTLSWHPEFLVSRALQQLLPFAQHLFCNVPEALLTTGQTDFRRALAILSESVDDVVVTRGAEGSVALVSGQFYEEPAMAILMVDATGAGDVFAAGYLTAKLRGFPVDQQLRIGNWAAAQAIGELGGSTGAPRWEQVAYFLESEVPRR